MDIETIVRDLGHNVTGVAVTRDEAVSQAMARRPASSSPTSNSPTTVRASMRSRTYWANSRCRDLHHRLSGAASDRRAARNRPSSSPSPSSARR
jgi:hypothetical protein